MLDPATCTYSANPWLIFTGLLTRWLTTPLLVIGPFIALLALSRYLPWRRWRRQLSLIGGAVLLLYFVAIFPPTVNLAIRVLTSPLPIDSGAAADAIVVLGRGRSLNYSRSEVAADLWEAGRAPKIFVSGRGDAPKLARSLQHRRVPEQVVEGESCSRTTQENAQFTANLLQPQGVQRVLLVTDSPHMLRSLLTFQHAGFEVIPYPVDLPHDLGRRRTASIVFREYFGLVSYGLRGRFVPQARRPSEELYSS